MALPSSVGTHTRTKTTKTYIHLNKPIYPLIILSFLVNIGSQLSIAHVIKCGCIGSYILYLLLPIGYCSFFILRDWFCYCCSHMRSHRGRSGIRKNSLLFYSLISISVPTAMLFHIAFIPSLVTAIHPSVQS